VPRISLFHGSTSDDGFAAGWRAARAGSGAALYRSHADTSEFRWVELAPDDAPPPDLPGRAASAVYVPVVDDLPAGATGEVLWLNPYEVPPEEDEAFIAAWTGVRDKVVGRPGYIGSRLHRTDDPAAVYRFVNVAPWQDVDTFTAAVATPAFAEAATAIYHQAHPVLFIPV
jgi:heme-degrading monooxygenase HmoA